MANYFTRLSVELVQHIFGYVLILEYIPVPPRPTKVFPQGISIMNGKLERPYSTALFRVDRTLSNVARRLTFSENRFVLGGDPRTSLQWLQSQPIIFTRLIKRLDLLITPGQFQGTETLDGWDDLIHALPDYLHLPTLCLSIDACQIWPLLIWEPSNEESWEEPMPLGERQGWLKLRYKTLMKPFQSTPRLECVKDFFVYYPQFESDELALEKLVKGLEYNSIARGKLSPGDRDWRMVHGWEWSVYDDTGAHSHAWSEEWDPVGYWIYDMEKHDYDGSAARLQDLSYVERYHNLPRPIRSKITWPLSLEEVLEQHL